ncbi:MAG: hypothetical protein PHY31_08525 [Smithellaceae bacterium]|nr:hypothetical protein [Smithellaceae bacterium]
MKLILDKKHGNRIEFLAKSFDTTMANMLRRYSTSRVPVMAIEEVVFYDNTSAFWDEYIAHRLGLMPLLTPEHTPESADVLFSLDAEGPKTIYASDLVSVDKDITMAKGNIVVATLGPNQHLRLEAKAVLGTGRKHAKYQAGLVGYGAKDSDVTFVVESFFQMEPADVLLRGCDVIEHDIEIIEEALGKKSEKKKKAPKEKASKKKAKEEPEEKTEEAEEKSSKKKAKEEPSEAEDKKE